MNRMSLVIVACSALVPMISLAETTGVAGAGLPFSNIQPSLGITYAIRTQGLFPGGSSSSPVGALGEISMFAGNFAPGGYMPADGRLLPISDYDALFSLIGTTYGGDGQTTFGIPDLRGRTAVGTGTGPGLTTRFVGETFGHESVTLTASNLPAHSHTVALTPSTTTTLTGSDAPYDKMQPSLAINYIVPLQGIFPTRDGQSGYSGIESVLGFVYATASDYRPNNWVTASGQLLPINQNQALFSLLGTTYGGDGRTTFALPDLRGRAPVGVGSTHGLGTVLGSEAASLTQSQMPAHTHTIASLGTSTSITGGITPVDNEQPSLALNYIIATSGIFPSRDGSGSIDEPLMGQISLFAGNFAPDGWAFASGQLLPIAQNTALFSILGTTYGGNGQNTYALPNLNNALAVGAGTGIGLSPWNLGQVAGSSELALSNNELAAHTHDAVVPEPSSIGLLALGLATFATRRRPK
jgi:microcystin-dependent protein